MTYVNLSYVFMTTNGGGVPRAKYFNCLVLEGEFGSRAPRETTECTEAVINEQSSAWAREYICKEGQLEAGLGSGLVSRLGACTLSLGTKGLIRTAS